MFSPAKYKVPGLNANQVLTPQPPSCPLTIEAEIRKRRAQYQKEYRARRKSNNGMPLRKPAPDE